MTNTDFRTRNMRLLIAAESTSGTEESLTPGSHACKAESIQYTAPFEFEQTNEHRGSLDRSESIIGGGSAGLSCDIPLKGSGAGGTAPEWGPFARAAGLAEANLGSAETGTAQTGSDSSITLAASGPSSTDDFYIGMPVAITGGTGSGQTRVITGYNGTSKVASVYPDWDTNPDNTSTYSIAANTIYIPASASLETVTAFLYDMPAQGSNARLRKLIGGPGNLRVRIPANRVARLSAQLTGIYPSNPSDVSAPTGFSYDSTVAPAFKGATVYLGGAVARFNELSFDLGNQVSLADDPTATYGRDEGFIAARSITGSINPRQTAASTRNIMADFVAGTKKALWVRWGTAAGNRISIYCPQIKYSGADPGDINGLVAEVAPFEVVGEDNGFYLCLD